MVYCISVFTHLSVTTGISWVNELFRVLKPGGILIITTLGDKSYHTELLPREKRTYEKEGIVIRGQYKEGKKMHLAMHNPLYVKNTLLRKFEIMEHLPAGFPYIDQDCWIAKKNS
jgi:predicted SAM-dependent methyltransferase